MKKDDLKLILIGHRKERNLTQGQVAELTGLGITRQFYTMIENVDRRPSVEVAKALGKVLDVDWTIFFDVQVNDRLHKDKQEVS